MRLSLHEVLAIVGSLDDRPGFDTPRERFRRFLLEHMSSVPVARTFLDEAQQLMSEQYQRALQDTVLAAGRLLGFEVTFGDYERHGAAARTAGLWLSRRRLAVTVQVWSDDAAMDSAAVARSLDAPLLASDTGTARTRLCVVSPLCSSRPRIEEAMAIRNQATRIVSLRSLMDLTTAAAAPLFTHDDVLRLMNPSPALEGAISLLTRLVQPARTVAPTADLNVDATARPVSYWVYVVREQQSGSRQPVGVGDTLRMALPAGETPAIRTADLLAFLVPSRGIVAQAEVATLSEESASHGPDAHASFVVGLHNIVILNPAIRVETEQRLNLELQAAVSQEPCVRVTRGEFETLTLEASMDAFATEADVVRNS